MQRIHTDSVSGRLCYLPNGGVVSVTVGPLMVAHVSGVKHCGSPHSCPVCMMAVRSYRAREVDEGLRFHLDSGGGAVFLTLTGAHHRGMALAPLYGEMATALGTLLDGRRWRVLRNELEYVGSMRVVEVTSGENGWHPHTHAVLLTESRLEEGVVAELRSWLFERWDGHLQRRGFDPLHPVYGLDLRTVHSTGGLAQYVTKVEDGWGVGLELTRADLKVGSVSPLWFLREFAETGDVDALGSWLEYERATFGRRFMRWSDGLRVRLLGSRPEVSDEEAALAEGLDRVLIRVEFGGEEWTVYVREGSVGEVVDQIERMGRLFIWMAGCLNGGHVEEVR